MKVFPASLKQITMKKIISSLFSLTLLLAVIPDSAKAQTNLVVNGNFTAGNTGFVCGLPYSGTCTAGTYFVANSFNAKCGAWPTTYDHTLGTPLGSLLAIDGDPLNPFSVWSQNVNVCIGTTYTFSFWGRNIYTNAFDIQMKVNSATVMTVTSIPSASWTQFTVTWLASSTGTVPIELYCTTGGAQRDFGIDDIFFGYNAATNVTPSSSICSGSCITLTASASGATSYSWSTGATTPSIVVCPGSTTSYSVTGIGCLTYTPATTTVTVNPTPTVTATATPSTLNPPSVTTSTISSSATGGTGFTYSWTPSSSLSSGTVSNPVATPTTTTVYTEAVTNSYGCTGYTNVTVNVTPESLCTLTYDYDLPDGSSSAITLGGIPSLSGMNIRISGTFTINSNLMFSGCNVEMEPGSSIEVTGSGTILYVTGGTHIFSCDGMWNGINLQNGTSAQIMNAAIIEDAMKGVQINQGAHADIEWCIFNRNYTAVELTSNTSATSPLVMMNCVVTSREFVFHPNVTLNPSTTSVWSDIVAGTAPAVINMKTPYYSYKSIYGVYATDVNALQVGVDYSSTNMNGFDNLMSTGIYLTRSNALIYNNQFRNITNASNCITCTPLLGDGINAVGSTTANYSLKVGGTSAHQSNTFTDVRNSVMVANYQLTRILSNTITNSSTTTSFYGGYGKVGFQVKPSANNTINILQNNVTNCDNAIWILRNNSTSNQTVNLLVDNNTVTANASGFTTNGIYVMDNTTAPTVLPTTSEINFNTIVEAYNCINLSNFKTPNDVTSNSCLTRYASSGSRNGIKLVNCEQQSVFVNHTKYTVAAGSGGNILAYGIFLQNSPNNAIRCNLIEQAVRSLVFSGGCTSTNGITQNTMSQGQDGLVLLTSGTVIGSQGTTADPSNNYWDLSTAPVFVHTIVNNSTTYTYTVNSLPTTGSAAVNPSIATIFGPVSITTTTSSPMLICGSLGTVPARLAASEEESVPGEMSSPLFIYPNPNSGTFSIETNSTEAKDVFVYDVMGKMVFSATGITDHVLTVDITSQASGIYFVKVVHGNSIESKRIIKQ